MIIKEYYQNINIKRPRDYFEKWYADVWHKRINKPVAQPDELTNILKEELAKVGASFTEKDNGYKFVVTFERDCDYTAFVLRWIL